MPDVDGVEARSASFEAHPDTPVVVLTFLSERERILDALDAGAVGYLLKDAEPEELSAASAPPPRAMRRSTRSGARAVTARAPRTARTGLTHREREVLGAVGSGLANKQIARQLGILRKDRRSRTHQRVLNRIGVSDRTQAACCGRIATGFAAP